MITKVTIDYYLCDPRRAGDMLLLAFESEDDHCFTNLARECESRGINTTIAMAEARERVGIFWSWFADPERVIPLVKPSELPKPIEFKLRRRKAR
jgi:hypothetical protein